MSFNFEFPLSLILFFLITIHFSLKYDTNVRHVLKLKRKINNRCHAVIKNSTRYYKTVSTGQQKYFTVRQLCRLVY